MGKLGKGGAKKKVANIFGLDSLLRTQLLKG